MEQEYYHDVVGFQGEFLFAENVEEARPLVVSGKGFIPVEGDTAGIDFGSVIRHIPLYRDGTQITRNYCAFWRVANSGYYVEEFGSLLKKQFALE